MNCLKHNKLLLFNCEQCNIKICSTCVTQDHKGHSFNEVESSSSSSTSSSTANTAQQIQVETNLKSIDQFNITISEQEHQESVKKISSFYSISLPELLGLSFANMFTFNSITQCLNILKESNEKKKNLVKDKIKQYHQELDQLQVELLQVLDSQYNETNEIGLKIKKQVEESDNIFKSIMDDYKPFNKEDRVFSSEQEEFKCYKEFSNAIEKNSQISQQLIIDQEKFHSEYIQLYDIDLQFNDQLIKLQQLVKYSKVEFKEDKESSHLLVNNIILDPFYKEKRFKVNSGQRVLDSWERVALLPAPKGLSYPVPIVKEIYFTDGYNVQFTPKFIPDTVTAIYLGNTTYPITKESIPNRLKEIYFCDGYSHDIPSNLLIMNGSVDIFIGDIKFKLPTPFKLGNTVGAHTFKNYKSAPIPNNSTQITHLLRLGELGHPIEKFEQKYRKLKLIDGFNQILNSDQLGFIYRISFESNHLHPFEAHQLKLSNYTFKNNYNHPIVIKDLPHIKSLSIGSVKSPLSKDSLSNNSITDLYFRRDFNHIIDHQIIPSTIVQLTIGNIKCEPNFSQLKSLKILRLVNNYSFANSLDSIPSNVEELCLGKLSFQVKPGQIPSTINTITFNHYFDQDFQPLVYSNNIETLKLGAMSKRFKPFILSNPLPPNIKNLELIIGNNNLTIGAGFISPTVKSLYVEVMHDSLFQPKSIPKTLKSISTSTQKPEELLHLTPFTIPVMKVHVIEFKYNQTLIGKKYKY